MVKILLRKAIRAKRRAHNPATKRQKDIKILKYLTESPLFQKAKVILLYLPIPHEKEVNTWDLLKKYGKTKNMIAPRVNPKQKTLSLFRVTKKEDLEEGIHGIPEPKKTCKKAARKEINLAIIPGIAFDKTGNRIGFGQGYYDRLLKRISCTRIALAYEFQILHAVPGQPHDVKVDSIFTEKGIRKTHE